MQRLKEAMLAKSSKFSKYLEVLAINFNAVLAVFIYVTGLMGLLTLFTYRTNKAVFLSNQVTSCSSEQ